MNSNRISEIIKYHRPRIIGLEKARISSVCIPLIKDEKGEYSVLFEVRASGLAEQPGDICLPGGMAEAGEDPKEAALRELSEELLILESQMKYLGAGNILYTGSLIIYTHIVELHDYDFGFNEESREVFTVPLEFFVKVEPEEYIVERKAFPPADFPYDRIQGGRDYRWRSQKTCTYFYRWEDRNIWGITAGIMKDFSELIRLK